MTKDEQKIKVAQIQKILGEYYGTVGRRENWDAAEEVVKLFCQPDVNWRSERLVICNRCGGTDLYQHTKLLDKCDYCGNIQDSQ